MRHPISKPRLRTSDVTRASVSFPSDVYAEIEKIAASKKVSVAWVVREAAERYVTQQWASVADREERA
ncbi:CopG family transcriptional regulator [Luteimonas saliphila]|uniref:ribbon-helix-helix domain-containing protein n=1 Tax=Luteimonas saliphila TaxID=2804919 RepID=UPI00192D9419|nr:CopG family transcriptional regulator [Luteimonas saliphila]